MTGAAISLLLGAAAWALYRPRWDPALQPSSLDARGRAEAADPGRDTGGEGSGVSDPALMLDLVAAILVSGRPLPTALRILSESTDPQLARILTRVVIALELASDWQEAWVLALASSPAALGKGTPQPHAAADVLRRALAFAASSGAPSAAVLHAQADQIRRSRAREAERRAAELGIHLVLPLGLCALPAFICLTVVPLLLALLPSF